MRPASVGAIARIARLAADGRPLGLHGHAVRAVPELAHRGAQDQPLLGELLGHPDRHELRPADEAVLLGSPLGIEEHVEASGRVDVEEDVQERHVFRLGGPDGLDGQLEQHPARPGGQVAAHPGGGGLPVESSGVRRLPGCVERDALGKLVEAPLRALHVQQYQGVDARDRAGVTAQASRVLDDVLPGGVGGKGAHPELGRQRREPVLGGPDPLAADLDDVAVADVLVQHPPADALARFDDQYLHPRGDGRTSRRQAGEAGPDDDEIGVACLRIGHLGGPYRRPAGRYGPTRWLRLRAAMSARRSGVTTCGRSRLRVPPPPRRPSSPRSSGSAAPGLPRP